MRLLGSIALALALAGCGTTTRATSSHSPTRPATIPAWLLADPGSEAPDCGTHPVAGCIRHTRGWETGRSDALKRNRACANAHLSYSQCEDKQRTEEGPTPTVQPTESAANGRLQRLEEAQAQQKRETCTRLYGEWQEGQPGTDEAGGPTSRAEAAIQEYGRAGCR